MHIHSYPSKLLSEAIDEFSRLPGIGEKTALRLVLHLLRQEHEDVERMGHVLLRLKKEVQHCKKCYNISDKEICPICMDTSRDHDIICVVENIKNVLLFEKTAQYRGMYHVLGGLISPMDGIGPDDLTIPSLISKVEKNNVKEVIFALSTTMEGDTTSFYLYKKIKHMPVKITTIARGVSFGNDLEYADELTLGRSVKERTVFDKKINYTI